MTQHDMPAIAIIGAGNMARALIHGLTNNGIDPQKIWVSNPTQPKLDALATQYNVHTTQNNQLAAQQADIIILATKPKVIKNICAQLSCVAKLSEKLIISIASAISISSINTWLGTSSAIIRTMPNTPSSVGAGATALFANPQTNKHQKNLAESIFRAVGIALWVPQEELLDVTTALSGSGPAYFFYILETMQQTAENMGLGKEAARLLAAQTALGAARIVMETDTDIAELRRFVTSPNGTTEQAIAVFDAAHLKDTFTQAMQAAKQRCLSLKKELES